MMTKWMHMHARLLSYGAALAGMLLLGTGTPAVSRAEQVYTLRELTEVALTRNPSMRVADAQREAAQAAVETASAPLNPELEAGAGPSRYRSGSNETRSNWGVMLSQPLEFSNVREARRAFAETNVRMTSTAGELTRTDLKSRVRAAYYDLLQRQALLNLAEEDRALLGQIRDRVKLRVELGESPRYELIKAETEVLAAERDYRAAQVHVREGKVLLLGLVGIPATEAFAVRGDLPKLDQMLSLQQLQGMLADSPLIRQARSQNEIAQARLHLEQRLRQPGLTVKAGVEQDPDLTNFRIGVAIPLPLWNQRQGPIAEATAGVRQAQAQLDERELSLQRELDAAYQRYQIARDQVGSFEAGLLRQAEAALKVAESAYRYGERGILDYLDAQRTYRTVRMDYLSARYDLVGAVLDIERLLGTELLEEQS
jgi:outer membrane protein, heavy metal efflux system